MYFFILFSYVFLCFVLKHVFLVKKNSRFKTRLKTSRFKRANPATNTILP